MTVQQIEELIVPLVVGLRGAAIRSGLSLTRVKELIATGEWPSFKDGRRRLIPVQVIEDWVALKMEEQR